MGSMIVYALMVIIGMLVLTGSSLMEQKMKHEEHMVRYRTQMQKEEQKKEQRFISKIG